MTGVQTCARSEEHTSELQSHDNLVCRLLLEKNNHAHWLLFTLFLSPAASLAPADFPVRHDMHENVPGVVEMLGLLLVPFRLSFFFLKLPAPPKSIPFPLPTAFQF